MHLRVASSKVLSERGSTRATFYSQSNKIVTLDGKTHVAWLDSISEILIATYTHATGTWSPPIKVGTGVDNHSGPALLCDSQGYLHIIFGPHTGPFQYCISARPNDAAEWVKQEDFGVEGTYPSAVLDSDDTLHIIYRGGAGAVRRLVYQRKPKAGPWSDLTELAASPLKSGYTHYHSALTIAGDQALHVAYDIYYNGAAKCAGHLVSRDRGDTWTLADGSRVELPVTPSADAFFRRTDEALKVSSVVCDSRGHPWISVTGPELWHHDGERWLLTRPEGVEELPPAEGPFAPGPLGIDSRDRLYWFGGLDGKAVVLCSTDGGRDFDLLLVADPDPAMPHRGTSIERPTGHNTVEVPWLLYSSGAKGPDVYGKGIFNRATAVRLEWAEAGR
ncbi:MAG: BNR-4 repeat-containing protein [Armatimonadota bacterium]